MKRIMIPAGFVVALLTSHAFGAKYIMGIGVMPGGFGSEALRISPNGQYVVGWDGQVVPPKRFVWTHGGGMTDMGAFQGYDVANNGVVVGENNFSPARWTIGGGAVPLAGLTSGYATGISADGLTIAGVATLSGQTQPFRWTQGTGIVGLGLLPGSTSTGSQPLISDDGSYIVGVSSSASADRVFGYDGTMHDLGFPQPTPGTPRVEVRDFIMVAGNPVIVGRISGTSHANGDGAFAKTTGGTNWMPLPSGNIATCISGDGEIVLGEAGSAFPDGSLGAIWLHGAFEDVFSLKSYLSTIHGIDMSGWQSIVPWDMTPDSRYIIGSGLRVGASNPEGFIVFIPEPATVTLLCILGLACRRRLATR